MDFFTDLINQFSKTFITENRWRIFLNGLKNTLIITVVAAIIGFIFGTVIALWHYAAEQMRKENKRSFGAWIMKFIDKIFSAYVAVMRGTPLAIQLMIMAFLIMKGFSDKIVVASVAFGLNSAAYVSEIIRGGIASVDIGQMEAGRSLGFNQLKTMYYIVLPQAIKNILPALCNEGIAVLKETSIVGLVAVTDLTRASDLVRSRTLSAFFPLVSVAVIYFLLVYLMAKAVSRLEKKLAKSNR